MKRFDKTPSMEDWFEYWLQELKDAGFVKTYTKDIEPYPLTNKIVATERYTKTLYKGTKREKVEIREKERVLLHESSYKPDFLVNWEEKAIGIFITDDAVPFSKGEVPFLYSTQYKYGLVTPIDVKSPFKGKNCSDATFSVNRKHVYEKFGIFINKAILMPNKKLKKPGEFIFPRTFTPTRYLFTDKTLEPRSIKNWKVKTLEEFLGNS